MDRKQSSCPHFQLKLEQDKDLQGPMRMTYKFVKYSIFWGGTGFQLWN